MSCVSAIRLGVADVRVLVGVCVGVYSVLVVFKKVCVSLPGVEMDAETERKLL